MSDSILDRLFQVVEARRRERPEGSYVVTLLDGGVPAIGAKVREEAAELVEAAEGEDLEHLAHEAADLLFHVWVLLGHRQVPPARVYEELERRFGLGGHVEKAARGAGGGDGRG